MHTHKHIQVFLALCLLLVLLSACKPAPAPTAAPPDKQATDTPTSVQPPAPQRIIFQSNRSGDWEIYSIDADGSDLTNLTNNPAQDIYPTWSPDGQHIAFLSNCDDQLGVYLMNPDGSALKFLASASGFNENIAWSPDSTRLAYLADITDEQQDIHVINIDGTGERNVTNLPGIYYDLSWSANGQRITYSFTTYGDSSWNIYSIAVDGSDQQLLVEDASDPLWSPDGTRIVYTDDHDIFVMNADGSNKVQLTDDPGQDDDPFWSSDSLQIGFISDRTGQYELYIMSMDGSNLRQLTTGSVTGTEQGRVGSSWSPDGTQIVSTAFGESNGNDWIYVINVDGSGLTRLTDDLGMDILPSWQPAGSAVTPASDGGTSDGSTILFEDDFENPELNANLWDFLSYPGNASYVISDGSVHIQSGISSDEHSSAGDLRSNPGFYPETAMLVFSARLRLDDVHMSSWGLLRQDEQGSIGFSSTSDDQFVVVVSPAVTDFQKFTIEGIDLTTWHIYRIELTTSQVSFYVDDGLVATADISLVADELWGIHLDSATNDSNQITIIDYVRLTQSGAQVQEEGQPQVEPVNGQRDVKIDGWVANPTVLNVDSFRAQELVTIDVELPQGGLHTYTGIPLYYILLSIVQIQPEANTLVIISSDGLSAEVEIQNLIESCANCLLAYEEQDGFFVAVMPGYPNELWLKDVVQLDITK